MQPNEKPSDAEIKMAEAVNVIFDQIKLICPGWKYIWTNESIEKKAKKFWVKALLDANIRSDLEIQCGLHKTLKSGSAHCPPVGKFISWCKPDPEFMGLPSAVRAYQEACRRIHPAGQFKRKEAIISEYLLVYPRYFDKRSRAQQVKHRTMQAAWRDACKTAGYGGMYHLRDLRKKGLTEEFLSQGENDKGGHETQAMRNHYRLIKPPKRARTTIRFEREQKLSE
ncbi:replication protein P [Marinobacter sp. AN1]|uniref:replication protein P n=1 Tax=Marinobacter sp. AN1 TaxID=2886046 RepID=UPI0022329B15|nr:replication protein P [Marinobacter sp. AN1]UZD64120.1 replication protein P [Marinobacter sp. AN1]